MPYRNGRVVDWRKTVNIKSIIDNAKLTEMEQAEKIVALLAQHKEFREARNGKLLEGLKKAAHPYSRARFNHYLNEVYDIGDVELIWLGM